MIVTRVRAFLDEWDVPYVSLCHTATYTAQHVAEELHVPGKDIAKTVIVVIDGTMTMTVLPATETVDFDLLGRLIGTTDLYLASEDQFGARFPDCELGAMPPFGNLYGMPVLVSETLAEDEEIIFNENTHTDLVRMSFRDYQRLVQPGVLPFSKPSYRRRRAALPRPALTTPRKTERP